jgi:hypothetical protein
LIHSNIGASRACESGTSIPILQYPPANSLNNFLDTGHNVQYIVQYHGGTFIRGYPAAAGSPFSPGHPGGG